MLPRFILLALVVSLLLPPHAAWACLWDYDTLRDEQRGLPTMSAILAGKWERHSGYFYAQRVERMQAVLARTPDDLAAIDNMAVALEKLGRIDEAIALMQEKLRLPDAGEHPHYTTHANLGTFYLHRFGASGDTADLDRGIEHIAQALEINANAHFGRERYQLQVAQYVRDAQENPEVLDRGSFILPEILGSDQTKELEQRLAAAEDDQERAEALGESRRYLRRPAEKLQPAIDGVVGMIRFGTGTSPHLYYALGDLLTARGDRHLAARAYLRALEFKHPRPEQVRAAMKDSISLIHPETTEEKIAASFQGEKDAAASWVAAYQSFEDDLVRRGVDLSDASVYQPFYDEHGQPRAELGFALSDHLPRGPALQALIVLVVVIGGFLVILAAGIAWWRGRRRRRTAGAFA